MKKFLVPVLVLSLAVPAWADDGKIPPGDIFDPQVRAAVVSSANVRVGRWMDAHNIKHGPTPLKEPAAIGAVLMSLRLLRFLAMF